MDMSSIAELALLISCRSMLCLLHCAGAGGRGVARAARGPAREGKGWAEPR
jgi:hypothetical protein